MGTAKRIAIFALAMGLLGPLPGFLLDGFSGGAKFLYGGFSHPLLMLGWYVVAAVPLFGTYCAAASVVGAILICVARQSPRKWIEPAAIIIFSTLAAAPIILLGEVRPAILSSCFWAIVLTAFRNSIFGRILTGDEPRFSRIYRWATSLN